jgi:hypothetical protein
MYSCGLQKCIARAFSPMMYSTQFAMVQIVTSLKFHAIYQLDLIHGSNFNFFKVPCNQSIRFDFKDVCVCRFKA